jgi:hypothetical protein
MQVINRFGKLRLGACIAFVLVFSLVGFWAVRAYAFEPCGNCHDQYMDMCGAQGMMSYHYVQALEERALCEEIYEDIVHEYTGCHDNHPSSGNCGCKPMWVGEWTGNPLIWEETWRDEEWVHENLYLVRLAEAEALLDTVDSIIDAGLWDWQGDHINSANWCRGVGESSCLTGGCWALNYFYSAELAYGAADSHFVSARNKALEARDKLIKFNGESCAAVLEMSTGYWQCCHYSEWEQYQ